MRVVLLTLLTSLYALGACTNGGPPCVASGQCSTTSTCTISGLNNTGATSIFVEVSCLLQSSTAATIASSPANTFTNLPNLAATGVGALVQSSIYYTLTPSVSGSQSITISGVLQFCSIFAASFSNTVILDGLPVGSASTGTTASQQAGSITASGSNELIVTGLGAYCSGGCTFMGVDSTVGIDSGFTIIESTGSNLVSSGGIAFRVISSTSTNPAWITDMITPTTQFNDGAVAYNLALTSPAGTSGPKHKVTME